MFKIFHNTIQVMLSKTITAQFQSKKMQRNALCRFACYPSDEDYLQLHPLSPATSPSSCLTQPNVVDGTGSGEEVVNLQELWDSLEGGQEKEQPSRGKIKISVLKIEPQEEQLQTCEFTEEQFAKMAGEEVAEEVNNEEKQDKQVQVDDLGDLWDQIDQQPPAENKQITTVIIQPEPQKESTPDNLSTKQLPSQSPVPKSEKFDLGTLLSQKTEKSLNCNISREYLIYDYQNFVLSCFQTNIHSYFGFSQSKQAKNLFYFYDLTTKEPIIECSLDAYDDLFKSNGGKKVKVDYEIEHCLKFRLAKNGQLIATAFHKYINNGILYNIKPFNSYQNQYEDSLALVEITDGFIGNNCYCNTNVYISQKYTNQPGQLKMIIGVKNGYLIANMGVNGVKSAPYNCRLQNYQSNFVYLLGLIDKEKGQFVVRVGEGMSPLIAFAISIGRKRYIDSFAE